MIRNARLHLSRSISRHQFRRCAKLTPSRPPTQHHHRTPLPPQPTSPFHPLLPATRSGTPTYFPNPAANPRRGYCDDGGVDYSKDVDEINFKFAEAREDIDAALEARETLYFDEEAECARESVRVVLHMFDELLVRLPEREKGAVRRSMGLKMEQLEAELAQLND